MILAWLLIATTAPVFLLFGPTACSDDDNPNLPKIGPPNSLGIYFDNLARKSSLQVQVGGTFDLYVFAFDVDGNLQKTSFDILGLTAGTMEVLDTVVYPVGIGSDTFEGLDGVYSLDHGSCYAAVGSVILLHLSVRLLQAVQGLTLRLEPSSLAPGDICPARPSVQHCDGSEGCLNYADDGEAVLNPG
jgi:hypothetical protein